MSKQKLEFDPQKFITWMKGNIVLVVLLIACIGAGVGLPMFAASWSEEVQQSLNKRTQGFSDIDALFKSRVTPPGGGEGKQVVINQELVDQYRKVAGMLRDDAQRVIEQAKQHNQKEYSTIYPELFGDEVLRSQLETLPQKFHAQLQSEYRSLLTALDAGKPPAVEDLVQTLEEARVRFMENKLSKPQNADLTKQQHMQLELYLTDRRMDILRDRAEEVGLYLDEETLGLPEFDEHNRPNVGTLFTWQWRYWAIADALAAIVIANGGQSELTSPVKRLTLVQVLGLPLIDDDMKTRKPDTVVPDTQSKPRNPTKGGGAMGMGGDHSNRPTERKPDKKPDRDRERNNNFGEDTGPVASHTNRPESTLYDTLQVKLRMVVSTSRIPAILDTFAQNNFATVVDIDLQPMNKFTSLAEGFDYGAEPVAELTIVLETVWLRAWTVELMPESVKEAMGI